MIEEEEEQEQHQQQEQQHQQEQEVTTGSERKTQQSVPSASRRSLSQGPSKSRAQLLARKQQLASSQSNNQLLGWSAPNNPPATKTTSSNSNNPTDNHQVDTNSNSHNNHDSMSSSHSGRHSRSTISNHHQHQFMQNQHHMVNSIGSAHRGLSAEAKLESLSEQLKLHQISYDPSSDVGQAPIEDVYILLAKKEKDLQLAAELGKVLLEKNDELSKVNELQAEEYSRRLEVLEEEKHKLRRRVEQLEGEYENRLIESQTDCRLLEDQLARQRDEAARREREKSRLIEDLGQQNQRLASELAEATQSEQLLSAQVEQLKERLGSGGTRRQDQDVQLGALKSEIDIVSQRKQDLERRLRLAVEERTQLSAALEDSGERLILMEAGLAERDSRLAEAEVELSELRDASAWLSAQLDAMITLNERLAANEGASELEPEALDKRSQLIDQLRELRLRARTRTRATEMKLLGQRRLQSRRDRKLSAALLSKQQAAASSSNATSDNNSLASSSDDLFNESNSNSNKNNTNSSNHDRMAALPVDAESAESIYKLLRDFQLQLERRRAELHWRQQQLSAQSGLMLAQTGSGGGQQGPLSANSSSGPDDSGISAHYDDTASSSSSSRRSDLVTKSEDLEPGSELTGGIELEDDHNLSSDTSRLNKRWQLMLSELRTLIEDLPCSTCHMMIGERQKFERLERDQNRISEELKKSEETRIKLSSEKCELEARLSACEEECASLKSDLASSGKSPDEIVKLAWQRRDEAVSRKNACEIALAKSRVENMQLSSQLMEVVQQKSRLAQQVAQFEDDIHYMTQDSVKAKFSWEEQAERLRRNQQEKQQQSAGISLGPLSSLLMANFTSTNHSGNNTNSSSSTSAKTTGATPESANRRNSKGQAEQSTSNATAPGSPTASGSIMRQFAANGLKLSRFWTTKSAA